MATPLAELSLRSASESRLLEDLCEVLDSKLESPSIADVRRAYRLAAKAHFGQQRLSGDSYIVHPLAVAHTLAEMNLDRDSIIAALLHDVLEDTPTAKDQIEREFGEDVAKLVDGVSKLTHLEFGSHAEAQAANLRKMMLAMVDDIRVILIKLADRLHNMRTSGVLRIDKRRRIARETLEIFAPIAQRLGIRWLAEELENLGFAALYPLRYRALSEAVRKARGNRKELMQRLEVMIGARLEEEGFRASVSSREKHVYSVYRKMRSKRLSFSEVFDTFAIRLVVGTVDDCYRALGVVHGLYKPMPARIKDYIAIPKANGYQSLHTVLFGPQGLPVEIQIRTGEMDLFANSGIAAHWLYKSDERGGGAQLRAREWLRGLLDMQQTTGSSIEFLENVKVDLFPDEIFVFSPKGDIFELPANATPVDFAYAVHSDIGHRCVAAKVDRRLTPLSTSLESGQTVEIITSGDIRPSPLWLNFAVTAKARTAIRHFLKNLAQQEALEFGRRLLQRALSAYGKQLEDITAEELQPRLAQLGYRALDELWMDIGLGNRLASLSARHLLQFGETAPKQQSLPRKRVPSPLAIEGTEGLVVSYARCCHPIPGDAVLGFLSAGKGLVVHRATCRNVADYRRRPEKWVHIKWASEPAGDFSVRIIVEVVERRGVLANVASVIAEHDANIENVNFVEHDERAREIEFTMAVRDRKHLARVIKSLRNRAVVIRVWRAKA